MNTTANPIVHDIQAIPGEDGRPRFLDDDFNVRNDDLGDWWLDLGSVDLPIANR
ncbi:MAG TPA: hypothetical protein VLM40_02485 [Gemmata sp.]|nr:hypothetical protein [Gemmata sp.]